MFAVLRRKDFLSALASVQSVAARGAPLPVLANVLVQTDETKGFVTLRTTDLDVEIVTRCSAQDMGGDFTVTTPASVLYEIVRRIPDDNAQVRMEWDGKLKVHAGSFESTCQTLPAENFPVMVQSGYVGSVVIACDLLRKALEQTRVAVSNDEARYCLCGLYWHVLPGRGLCIAATDGHRLARFSLGAPPSLEGGMPSAIIPRKTVAHLYRILSDTAPADLVECHVAPGRIRFQSGGTTVVSKLVDGQYPDYEKAIPLKNDKHVHLATKALLGALSRVTIVVSDRNKFVTLHLSANTLVLVSDNPDLGSTRESVDVRYEGPDLRISFNARYLGDIVLSLAQDEVVFSMQDAQSAVIISAPNDGRILYVLMPVCL